MTEDERPPPGSPAPALVRELQERAARAVPATVQEHSAGCWLRHTDSPTTWWAGAALAHDCFSAYDVQPAIAAAESFYAGHRAPTRFQICPACPAELDGALSDRGYWRSGDVSLQVAAAGQLARPSPAESLGINSRQRPEPAWCRVWAAAQHPAADPAGELRLLQRVDAPSTYVTAQLSGRPVAVGRAVADGGWTGVFGMATLPQSRRRGAAAAVLAALADWAVQQHCPQMYLQVAGDSAAARRLYGQAGFEELCTYHYRTA